MYLCINIVLFEKTTKNYGIGCRYLLAVEPFYAAVFTLLRYGEGQTALGEPETADNLCIFLFLEILILAYDAYVCHPESHALRYVIVTEIKHFEGEIA